jgi:hypothetical protein
VLPGQDPKKPGSIDFNLICKMNKSSLAMMTHNVNKNWYYLYLYDHAIERKYLGYIDLLKFIDFEPHDAVVLLK